MKTSEQTSELMTALAKAQGEFTNVKAEADNPFHKSKYARLDAVVAMIRPVMLKHELVATHTNIHRVYEGSTVNAYLQTRISHKDQWVQDDGAPLLMRSTDKNGKPVEPTMQTLMAATTYAKRMGLMALLSIASTEEDDDGESPQGEWAGPLKKTALAEQGHALHRAITSAESTHELKEVQVEFMAVIEQLMHDLPNWWYGDGADIHGAKAAIVEKNAALAKAEETIEDIV